MLNLNYKIELSVLSLILVLLTNCNYMELHGQANGSLVDENSGANCTDPNLEITMDQITFAKIKSEILDPHCLRCHNPGRPSAGIDVSTYNSVKARLTQIDFAISRNIMPPSGPLDPVKKGLMADWIKAGAIDQVQVICNDSSSPVNPSDPISPSDPSNPNIDPAPKPTPAPTPITSMPADSELNFAFIKTNIFELRCISCHSDAGGNRGGLNLERYSEVEDELDDIIEEVNQGTMPPSPRPSLSLLEKNILIRWARLGAPR